MLKLLRTCCPALATCVLLVHSLPAQDEAAAKASEEYVRSHYTKYEYRIPMRDGKRLFTAVYVAKDPADGAYPVLMDGTPYRAAPYGEARFPLRVGPSEEVE